MQESDAPSDDTPIPLLQDVVHPQKLAQPSAAEAEQPTPVDDHERITRLLQEGMIRQLNHQLKPVIASAVETGVDRIVRQTRQLLLEELHHTLEKELRVMIAEAVEKALKK
jgi:hypothetical protein